MPDLTRIDAAQPVEITDGLSQTAALTASDTTGTEVGIVTREARIGQKTMANSIPVVVASDQIGSAYDEDSPHANEDRGAFILAVRNDGASATFCTDDGDYSPISVDSRGRLYVVGDFGTVTVVPSGTQTVAINHTVTTTYSGTQTVAVSNATINNFEYAEDSVHTSAHVGSFVLAVRNDSAATTFCSATGDYSPISVDNVGRVFVTGTVTSAIAQSVTIVPSGTQTVTGTVTAVPSGTFTTTYSGTQTVAIVGGAANNFEYAEDSVHTSAHVGAFVLAVRNDSAATTFCSATGDYSPISVDNVGRVFVTGTVTSAIAQSVTIVPSGTQAVSIAQSVTIVPSGTQTVTGTVTAVPSGTFTTTYSGTQTVAITTGVSSASDYAEDSIHTSAHVGSFVLAVRNDSAATTFCSATGDYSPISVDNVGRVFVTGTVTNVPSGTQAVSIAQTVTTTYSGTQTVAVSGTLSTTNNYAEDSIHTTAHVGSFILAVRNDSAATTFCNADGDYSPISVDNVGRVFVTGTVTSTIAQSVTIVPSGTQAVSIAQSVTIVPSGTQTVTGTVTAVPSGTFTTTYSGTQTVAITSAITSSSEYLEDTAHTSAHYGTFILAVRNDAVGTTFANANGDYSPISVDNVGQVFVTGTVTAVPTGTQTVAGTVAATIAQSVTIVPSGTQTVTGTVTSVIGQTVTTTYSGTQTVAINNTSITNASDYAEDSIHTSAHVGSFVLAVRNDSAATTFCSATGDYSPISVDNVGRVFVTGTVTSTIAQSVTIVPSGTQAVSIAQSVTIVPSGTQTVTGTVTAVPSGTFTTTYSGTQTVAVSGSLTTADGYAEDSIHTSAHVGSFVLAVRNDSASTTFCSATGDYSPISVDNVGRVFVTGTVTSTIAQSVTIVPSGTQTVTGTVTIVPSGTQAVSIAQTVTTTYSGTQTVAITTGVSSASDYAEDSIHTSAHVGSFILAVRNDSAATTFCSATGDYSPISVDNVGRVFVTGTVTSAIAQSVTIVPSGTQAVSIAQSVTIVPSGTQTVTGTVTAVPSGTFTTTYSGTQTVAISGSVTDNSSYAEDSVHTTAHVGNFILAVRNDAVATTFCNADGDYSPISVDNVGRVFVTGTVTSAIAQSVTIVPSGTQTVTGTVTSVIGQTVTTTYSGTQTVAIVGGAANNFEYDEDSVHTTAHVGAFVLAVRNDSASTTFCSATGDYSPISVDNVGRVFVTGTVTNVPSGTQAVSIAQSVTIVPSGTQTVTGTVTAVPSGTFTTTYSGTQTVAVSGSVTDNSSYAEDSIHTTAHVGNFVLAVRNDAVATTFCNADGDYSPISVDNVGRVFVTGTVTSTIAQSVTIVPSGTQAVSIAQSVTIVPSGTQTVTGTVTSVIGQTVTTTYSGTQTVAITTGVSSASDYAEDSVHTTAHVGSFILAVRNDSAATTFCSASGDYSPISVDNVGRVFVTGTVTSAIAQSVTIVPSGTQAVSIAQTVTTTYSGTQTVAISGSLTTADGYAEDSVHTTAHVGSFVLAVRNDSASTTFCSATGDYSPISVDNVGRVFVTGTVTSTIAQSVTIVPSGTQTVTGTVTSVIGQTVTTTYSGTQTVAISGTLTNSDGYAEDSIHTTAHVGAFILAVRNDSAATTFCSATGDYSPISVDNVGRVFVTGTVTSAIAQSVTIVPSGTQAVSIAQTVTTTYSGTQTVAINNASITTADNYAEDSVHTTAHVGSFILAVRNDSAATTFCSATGDYSPISVDNVGRVFVTGTVTSTIAQTVTTTYSGTQTVAVSGTVTTSAGAGASEYAEDSIHTSAHVGAFVLAVRNDSAATTFCNANGDYSPISVDNVGRVIVTGTVTSVSSVFGQQTMANSIPVVVASDQTGTAYEEDSPHANEDRGAFILAVRNDGASTTFCTDNGDYSPLSVDSRGRLYVVGDFGTVTVTPTGTQTVAVNHTVTTTYSGTQTVAVSNATINNFEYAEDSVHTSAHVGAFVLAVRNDSAATTFCSATGDYSPISVDNVGRVFVTGTVTSAIAQSVTIVPSGTQTVTGTVTAVPSGTFTTTYSGTQTVAVVGGAANNFEYAEDSIHTSAHVGAFVLAVRNDSAATTFCSASGDYSPISVDNVGRVFVTGTVTSAIAQSVTIVPSGTQTVTGTVTAVPSGTFTTTYSGTQTVAVSGTLTTSDGYAEDSVHTSAHVGSFVLAVRNDSAATTFCSATGDYSPISVDNVGRVFVTGTVTSTIAQSVTIVPSGTQAVSIAQSVTIVPSGTQTVTGTVTAVPSGTFTTTYSGTQTVAVSGSVTNSGSYAEDSIHTTAHVGSFVLAVRNDAVATTFCNADGDYSPISVDNVGRVFVTGTVTSAIAQSVTIVPSGTQAVSIAQTVTTTYSGTQTVAVTGTVTTSGTGGGTEYAEDSVHTTGHLGTQMLAVRNDAVATTFCNADGDYSPISVDNVGRVFVTGTVTSTIAQSVTIVPSGTQTVTGTVTAVPSGTFTTTYSGTQTVAIANAAANNFEYAEDSVHTSAHVGAFVLAVRNDSAATTFCSATGDYSPISVDNVGRVFVTGTVTNVPSGTQAVSIAQSVTIVPSGTQTVTGTVTAVPSGTFTTTYSGTQTVAVSGSLTTADGYAEDSVHTSAHVGSFVLAVRNDSAATTFCSATGDYSPISVDNVGRVFVTGTVTNVPSGTQAVSIAQSVTIVPSGTQTVTGTVTAVPSGTFTTTYSGTQTVAINNASITTADNYAEDSVHTSAHVGSFVLAVRNDSAATTFCSATGDYSPISVDNVGRVFVTGTVTSTIAQTVTTTYSGTQTVAVSGTVTTSAGAGASEYAEDSVHTSAHVGAFVLAVRNDSAATTFCSATGDYSPISVDNVGRVFVTGTVTSVSSVFGQQTMANSIPVVIASDQTGTGYLEDAPHANADRGSFILAVRNDAVATTFCNTDGDYSPISVDNVGRVFVTGTVTSTIAQTVTTAYSGTQTVAVSGTVTTSAGAGASEYAEDSVHTTAHVGSFVLAVRNDSAATTFCSATGDYSPISVDNVGRVFVTGTVTSTIAQSVTIVPSGTQAVSIAQTVTTTYSGTQTVAVSGTLTNSDGYAEDSVHTTAHVGSFVLAVRNDSAATTFCNANGDYSPISVDNVGRVFVTGTVTSTIAQTVTTTYSGTQTVAVSGTLTNSDGYAEDSVHTSAHVGSFVLAVRNDSAATTFCSASGDYSPISVDNVGRVFVTGTVTSAIAQSVTIVPSGTQTVSGTVTCVAAGDIAHDTADSGNPIKIGGVALTANPTAVATGDRVNAMFDTLGKQVILQGSMPDLWVDGRQELTTTTSTGVISAGGSGVRTMLTHIFISNANASPVTVSILDGSTQKFTQYIAAAGGGAVIDLTVPFRGTANTAWNAQVNTSSWTAASGSGVYVTMAGYRAV